MQLKVSLSSNSIDEAIEALKKYNQELERKAELLVKQLGEEGYKLVKLNLADIHYTGELQSSVHLKQDRLYARIFVNSKHAIYVEFGTGSKGASTPYIGNNDIGWQYNIGETIGWYNINGVMKYGWFYYDELTGRYKFTEGMPSRPFMYDSATTLRYEKLINIVNEVFG